MAPDSSIQTQLPALGCAYKSSCNEAGANSAVALLSTSSTCGNTPNDALAFAGSHTQLPLPAAQRATTHVYRPVSSSYVGYSST